MLRAIIIPLVLCLAISQVYGGAAPYKYEEQGGLGPDDWPYITGFSTCSATLPQSPINIVNANTVTDADLAPITFSNVGSFTVNVSSTSHNVYAYVQGSGPTISGSDFGSTTYTLAQFHVHWGWTNYDGSEHQINGQKYPLEMHLVFNNAAKQVAAVIGLLFYPVASPDNAALSQIIPAFANDLGTSADATGVQDVVTITNFGSLVGSSLSSYYRYNGTLTNPPCASNIIWSVAQTAMPISMSQLSIFRNSTVLKFANNRDVQPLLGRTVWTTTAGMKGSSGAASFSGSILAILFLNAIAFLL